jgi:hypothetical protein
MLSLDMVIYTRKTAALFRERSIHRRWYINVLGQPKDSLSTRIETDDGPGMKLRGPQDGVPQQWKLEDELFSRKVRGAVLKLVCLAPHAVGSPQKGPELCLGYQWHLVAPSVLPEGTLALSYTRQGVKRLAIPDPSFGQGLPLLVTR